MARRTDGRVKRSFWGGHRRGRFYAHRWQHRRCSGAVPFRPIMGDIGKPIRETDRPAPVRVPEPEPEPEPDREPEPEPDREPPPPPREPEPVEAQRA